MIPYNVTSCNLIEKKKNIKYLDVHVNKHQDI